MFFSWGQPFRHLFLQIKLTKNNVARCTALEKHWLAGRRRRRAYSGFRARCKRQTVLTTWLTQLVLVIVGVLIAPGRI